MRWFAMWEAAWERPIVGRQGQEFERAKLAVNHGYAIARGAKI